MKFTQLLPLIKKSNHNAGLTLLEILVGSTLMAFLVSIAGWGLVHILAMDQKASARETIKYHSNRALEFLTDEIRQARKIESDAVAALAESPDFTLPTGAKPIVVFQVPDVPQRIFYYTRPIEEGEIWEGPDVIERWGPPLDENGQYDPAEINNPENWEYSILIDSIDNTAHTPSCETDWQASNADATQGFNACVNPDEKLVKLNLATTTSNKTWHKDVNYQVETMAFARSNIVQGFTEDTPIFTINNNQLNLPQSANIKFEVLGGALACSSTGPDIPVETYLYKDGNETAETWDTSSPLILSNQAAGTTFDVESVAKRSVCGSSISDSTISTTNTESVQLRVLVDGDTVPDEGTFANQASIDVFLREYIKDGKISLAENQAIYLFELWGPNESAGYFDLQDNVVLATVDKAN